MPFTVIVKKTSMSFLPVIRMNTHANIHTLPLSLSVHAVNKTIQQQSVWFPCSLSLFIVIFSGITAAAHTEFWWIKGCIVRLPSLSLIRMTITQGNFPTLPFSSVCSSNKRRFPQGGSSWHMVTGSFLNLFSPNIISMLWWHFLHLKKK